MRENRTYGLMRRGWQSQSFTLQSTGCGLRRTKREEEKEWLKSLEEAVPELAKAISLHQKLRALIVAETL